MRNLLSDNAFDQIRNYALGRSETLPNELAVIKKRWTAAYDFMLDSGLKSDWQVSKKLMDIFHISQRQAYADIASAKRLYGDIRKSSKEAERYFASENAKENYEKAWSMFLATKKYQWYIAAVLQQKIHAKVNGLEKDDPDLPDPSKINPPIQILQINLDFLTSKFAHVIDPKAKERINALLDQVNELVTQSRIGDYLDTTIDIPHIEE